MSGKAPSNKAFGRGRSAQREPLASRAPAARASAPGAARKPAPQAAGPRPANPRKRAARNGAVRNDLPRSAPPRSPPGPSQAARKAPQASEPRQNVARDPADAELLYGLRASLAVFERRRQDILRIDYEAEQREPLSALLDWAAEEDVPVRERAARDLADQADSTQHEGVLLQVRPRTWLAPKDLPAQLLATRGLGVALDRVRNPQNIGAILRSAAFFGAQAALLGAPAPHPGLPAFALRVAEGAAEHLTFSRTTDLADTLARLRGAGVHVIGADTHAPSDADDVKVPGATVLVLGHEREGLGSRIRSQCDALVSIRGSGAVESLNVAVAAGVLFAQLRRARERR